MDNSQFIDVALKLYADKGYEGTSLREVARQSGVGPSVLSYRFGSKKGLLEAVIKHRILKKTSELEFVLNDFESLEDFKIRFYMMLEIIVKGRFENLDQFKVMADILRDVNNFEQDHPICSEISVAMKQVCAFFQLAFDKGYLKTGLTVKQVSLFTFSIIRDSTYSHEANLRFLEIDNASEDTRKEMFKTFVNLMTKDSLEEMKC